MRSLNGKNKDKRRRSAVAPNPSDLRVLMDPKTTEDCERTEYATLVRALTDNAREKSLRTMFRCLTALQTRNSTILRDWLDELSPADAKDQETFRVITQILAEYEKAPTSTVAEADVLHAADIHRMGIDGPRLPEPISAYMRANSVAIDSPADRMSWLAINQLQTELLRLTAPSSRVAPAENCEIIRKRHAEDQEIVDEVNGAISAMPPQEGIQIMEIKLEPGTEPEKPTPIKDSVNAKLAHLDENARWAARTYADRKRRALQTRVVSGRIEEDARFPDMGQPISVEHIRLMLEPAAGKLKPCSRARVNSSTCIGNNPEYALSSVEMPDTTPVIMQQFRRPEEVAKNIIPVENRPCILCILFEIEHAYIQYKLQGVDVMERINDHVFAVGMNPNQIHPSLLLPEFDGTNNERRTGIIGNVPSFSALFRLLIFDKKKEGGAVYRWPMQVQDFS